MPKLNFLFLPEHNTGGHFLTWSIDFLSGQQHYFSENQLRPVISANRLLESKNNAHRHKINLILGYQEFIEFVSKMNNINVSYVNVYAAAVAPGDLAIQKYNTPYANLSTQAKQDLIIDQRSDTAQLLEVAQKNHKLVFVDFHNNDFLNTIYNNRFPMDANNIKVASSDQLWETYKNLFYPDVDQTFSDDYIWDKREKLALMRLIPERTNYYQLLNKKAPHLYYTTDDIWNDLPNVILEIIDFLGLEVNYSNLESWTHVYNAWRQVHDNFFSRNFNQIIESIVNGNYMSLKRYRLNFYHEVLIQHALITNYNLNLKTWQLEKFPDNTLDIHHLLEPNIHHL